MSRNLSREMAFRTIYSKLFNRTFDGKEASDDLAKNVDENFYNEIVSSFDENFSSIQAKIENNLKGLSIERVYKIDLALIFLAITEIDYVKTSYKIVINEIIELAKKYSTDKSFKFINGFLANLVKA